MFLLNNWFRLWWAWPPFKVGVAEILYNNVRDIYECPCKIWYESILPKLSCLYLKISTYNSKYPMTVEGLNPYIHGKFEKCTKLSRH